MPILHTLLRHHGARSGQLLLAVLCAVLFLSCGAKPQQLTQDSTPEGFVRARALLSVQQRREHDKFYLEAQRHIHKGNLDAAHDLLRRALEINPNSSESLYELGNLLSTASTSRDSIFAQQSDSLLLRAHQLEPSNPFYTQTLAARYHTAGKYARAAQLYEKLCEASPTTENLNLLLQTQLLLHNTDAALHTLDRIENIEGKSEKFAYDRYNIYNEAGDKENALKTILKMREDYPDQTRIAILLGNHYTTTGDYNKAMEVFAPLVKTSPNDVMLNAAIIELVYTSQGVSDSLTHTLRGFAENHNLDPQAKPYVYQYLIQEAKQGKIPTLYLYQQLRYALAQTDCSATTAGLACYFIADSKLPTDSLLPAQARLLGLDADNGALRLQTLSSALKTNNSLAIDTICQGGIHYDPDNLIYPFFRSIVLVQRAKHSEALDILQTGINRANLHADSILTSNAYATIGDLQHQLKRKGATYAAYDRALRFNADNADCLNNYAYFLTLDNRDLKKALRMAAHAAALEPDNATIADTYAWALFKLKRYEQARTQMELCLQLHEQHERELSVELMVHAGDIYSHCGQRQQALDFWRRALRADDAHKLDVATRKRLAQQVR